jgi:hypothetical protein
VANIRVRLLKIGAAILRNMRRVRVMLATHHPLRELFAVAAARLMRMHFENGLHATARRAARQEGAPVTSWLFGHRREVPL